MRSIIIIFVTLIILSCGSGLCAQYQPVEGNIMTRWAKEVSPDNALPEYPRPQMVREKWLNLNGLWDYAVVSKDSDKPTKWDGQILVPYCIESALSGIKKAVTPKDTLWYRREFTVPKDFKGERLLLHFGSVDWHAKVWVNGSKISEHKGGYDAFTFDITEALNNDQKQEIVVSVWDPTSDSFQPRGKQVLNPEGIWYTAVTGIWQTVWIEAVPQNSIDSVKIIPDVDSDSVNITAKGNSLNDDIEVYAEVSDNGKVVSKKADKVSQTLTLKIKQPKLWSPDNPFLYDLKIELRKDGKTVDMVKSYFGMRKIEVKKDKKGINRLFLNDEPIFMYGPLDQGWWPDGLYTAPTDEALRYDVEVLKDMGMNCLRKHVKVEPSRYYYHCDKIGMLIWQDMPSGDRYIGGNDPDFNRSEESETNFFSEWKSIIDMLRNNPSVVIWVPFNEGWGQFKTNEVLEWTKKYDPTRLVDGPSGWSDRGGGDMHDMHSYPGPGMFDIEENRASVLGEFGGLGWPAEDHLWWNKRNWGYRTYQSKEELNENYINLMKKLPPLIGRGLSAAIYTQTTDVEGEVNGLMTYDRAMTKIDPEKVRKYHLKLYEEPPVYETLVPNSSKEKLSWKYTFELPASDWFETNYDDSAWKLGKGMFGTEMTPNVNIGTEWKTSDIWIRRDFELQSVPEEILLSIYYDEDAEVYINGILASQFKGYTTTHVVEEIAPKALKSLKKGKNTFAVHCKNTAGGQAVDVGLMKVEK